MTSSRYWILAAALALSQLPMSASAADPAYVAGLAPWQRPEQAPHVTADAPLDRKLALHGIAEPLPSGLKFLDDQGGWFNPFTRPGMTGPYDLRGWHSTPPSSRQEKK